MQLKFSESVTINGSISDIWTTATDAGTWADWDPHLVDCGFDGPFAPGGTGWTRLHGTPGNSRGPFTVTAVDPERSYSTESPMPMGKMLITTRFDPAGTDRVTVTRDIELHGGFVPFFRLFFLKMMRRDIPRTFAALEKEAARRSVEAGEAV
ncbi:SRPBCC family protein [Streptomyces sp. NPDC019531]|uniref:SRPBCC family protein n=1 Tax=Streptomyces sp. NPDC019531 TaxID=3365062 RepID=UPI00384DA7A1